MEPAAKSDIIAMTICESVIFRVLTIDTPISLTVWSPTASGTFDLFPVDSILGPVQYNPLSCWNPIYNGECMCACVHACSNTCTCMEARKHIHNSQPFSSFLAVPSIPMAAMSSHSTMVSSCPTHLCASARNYGGARSPTYRTTQGLVHALACWVETLCMRWVF